MTKPARKPPPSTRIVMRDVKFTLTEAEQLDKARAAAQLGEERQQIATELDRIKASFKSKLKDVEAKIAFAMHAVATGEEVRAVDVEETFDFDAGIVVGRYAGKEIDRRKLTPEEAQLPLDGV